MANRILVDTEENIEEPAWISRIEPFLLEVMDELSYDKEEVSVYFCSDAFIQNLNKEYRNIDGPTDVLSFENGEEYTDYQGDAWRSVGDIVISLETLPKNAQYFEVSCNEELKRLLIHGLLHLHGLDHGDEHVEKDAEPVCEMLKIQKRLMQRFESTKIYD
ncbi:MAG: rRNA maturation RNase YbeY [Treponema sp.]|nr:rRNA maturation RNase YbeY [Treponema sp.]